MVRFASEKDISELKSLWKSVFCDSDEYINAFFSCNFSPESAVVSEENGKIAGVLHLLPRRIFPDTDAKYWYGGAVLPEYRKRGIYASIIDFVKKYTAENGINNLCVPAPGLHDYYADKGFKYEYRVTFRKLPCTGKIKTKIEFEPADPNMFLRYPNIGDAVAEKKDIAYAISENIMCGGYAFKFFADNICKSFFVCKSEKGYTIRYSDFGFDTAEIISYPLAELLGTDNILFEYPDKNGVPKAMTDYPLESDINHSFFFTLE